MAKIERLNKPELVKYCKNIGLETKGKSKNILMEEAQKYGSNEIKEAIQAGKGHELLTEKWNCLQKNMQRI